MYRGTIHLSKGPAVILSFKDKLTQAVAEGRGPKGFPTELVRGAQRKLAMLNAARRLDDLKSPPGNNLHALSADRKGQHALRINDQFRLCFRWTEGGAEDVEITDYP
jgi:proteic killer suppression protein